MTDRDVEGKPERDTPEELFELLWETLVDVLGAAATATLLARSAKRITRQCPELESFEIRRVAFDYRYDLPPKWTEDPALAMQSFYRLAEALVPLLADLTGDVILQRLRALEPFRRAGLFMRETR